MPKAVAILEGDSSSLVASINDAKGAMQKLEGEGRKLTDQLRDVADEADKAAGNLVNKIGGGTAIKAIAGVTAGFAAAQTALGAFSGSMQAFYSTQGEQGAKAMADIDTALSKMQGQLFTAVMGTDNLEEATQTLLSVIGFLTDAVNVALAPLRGLGVLVRYLADTNIDATRAAKAHADEMVRQNEFSQTLKTNYDNITVAIAKNRLNVMQLTGSTEDLRKAQIRQQMDVLNGLADQLKAAEVARDQQEISLEVAAKAAENHRQAVATAVQTGKTGEEFTAIVSSVYAGLTMGTLHAATEARKGWSADTKAGLEGLGRDYQALQLKLFAVGEEAKKTAESVNTVGSSRAPAGAPAAVAPTAEPEVTDPYEKRRLDQERWLEEQRVAREKELQDTAKANKERIAMFGSATDEQIQLYYEAQIEKTIADKAAFEEARQRAIAEHDLTFDLTQDASKWAEEQRAKEKAASDEKVAGIEAGLKEYGNAAAQQLAAGEKASKIAEKMARKALGGQIAALGDKAMAEAAIMGAALNPMAIPMGAAGIAAYAAAAALGSDAKKATSSTPAVATAPQQMNTNVSYNLQVDAAFANGESIARQFSMAQREAQRRGMVPAGVF